MKCDKTKEKRRQCWWFLESPASLTVRDDVSLNYCRVKVEEEEEEEVNTQTVPGISWLHMDLFASRVVYMCFHMFTCSTCSSGCKRYVWKSTYVTIQPQTTEKPLALNAPPDLFEWVKRGCGHRFRGLNPDYLNSTMTGATPTSWPSENHVSTSVWQRVVRLCVAAGLDVPS